MKSLGAHDCALERSLHLVLGVSSVLLEGVSSAGSEKRLLRGPAGFLHHDWWNYHFDKWYSWYHYD